MPSLSKEVIAWQKAHRNDTLQPNLIASAVLNLFFSTLSIVLRLLCRRLRRAGLEADDWFALTAMALIVGHTVSGALAIEGGMGLHIIFAPDPALVVKNSYAGQVLYSLSTFFIKMSLLALYRRLFPTAMMKTGTVIIGLLVFGYSGALIGVDLTRCIPMQKLWNPDLDGWCMDTFIPFTVLAVANVVTDILILALPIRPVSKLNLDRSRKLSVLGVFLTGGIVCIFGIIRCWAVTQASATDPTWDNVQGGIWSDVEVTVGLVCASLPTYRPLFSRRVRETNFPLSYRTAKSTKGNLQIYGGKSIQLATRMSGRRTWTRVEADQDEQSFQRLSDTTLEHIPEGVIKVRHELHQY